MKLKESFKFIHYFGRLSLCLSLGNLCSNQIGGVLKHEEVLTLILDFDSFLCKVDTPILNNCFCLHS